MKKPTLSDFNLTERDLQTYEVQKKNWMNCFGKICRAKERNHKITVTVGVLSFVIFCVLSFALQEPIFLIPTILIPAITGIFFYIPDYAISKWDKIKENIFFNTLPYDTDEYHYIDKSLEESITCYNRSLSNYEEYLKRVNETFWISMSGYQFENEIADLFRKLGYNIHITPKSGDGGVDIILEKDGKRIAVQCKHHSKPVGPAPVRELMGVVASQNFDSGIFISLNGYTSTVSREVLFSSVKIELLSLQDIMTLLNKSFLNINCSEPAPFSLPEDAENTLKLEKKIRKVQTNSVTYTESDKSTLSIKYCDANCSTCRRDTCIYDKND